MNEPATTRMGVSFAPGGLRLAQDLVNTATTHPASRAEDWLKRLELAQGWLDAALPAWADATGMSRPTVLLRDRDLAPLRHFREQLRTALRHDGTPLPPLGPVSAGAVTFDWSADGRMTYTPRGDGAAAVTSLALAEIFLAQRAGTWTRLKICREAVCGISFYDNSPPATRIWHDTKSCGNRHNLRTSRARRSATAVRAERAALD